MASILTGALWDEARSRRIDVYKRQDKDGVVYHLTHDIPESDFDIAHTDENGKTPGQVEIIGWLYQYYNTEPKDEVFALLKKNVKITKERIPAATQLFPPDWICLLYPSILACSAPCASSLSSTAAL